MELFQDIHSTDTYIIYCMQRVELLLHHGVRPVLVFDGAPLPMKAEEKASRTERKQSVHAQTEKLLSEGDHAKASSLIQTALDVTFEMRHKMIKVCQQLNIGEASFLLLLLGLWCACKQKQNTTKQNKRLCLFPCFHLPNTHKQARTRTSARLCGCTL